MNQSKLMNRRCRAAAGALAAVLALPAFGQVTIEEIVVTSQKREQSLQEVPIAVSAFDAETLRRSGLKDIRDLQQLSPSLVLTSTQSESAGTTARLRGVGTTGDNLGLESSVAVFIDGVYRNRNSVALTDLGNLERIEVLRGPQGTLFGKNASAGLIHVITKEPDVDEFSGYVSGSYGDYEEIRIGGGVTGPIVEGRAGFSLDASWTERDGFIDNVSGKPGAESEYNDRDRYLIRGQLTSQIGEAVDLRLIADYASRDETCCAAVTLIDGPTAGIINTPMNPFTGGVPLGTVISPADPFARNTTANPPPSGGYISEVDEYGVSLEVNWDVGPGTLTSISAYRNWESDRSQDLDYTDAEILYRVDGGYGNDFETLTQELRYTWEASNIDFMLGFYYVDEELDVLDGIRVGSGYQAYVNLTLAVLQEPLLPPGSFVDGRGALTDDFVQETDSYAFFTHNTWHATDRLNITVGLRYTDEEKDVTANLVADNPACLAVATGQLMLGPTGRALTCLPLIGPLVDNALNPVLMGAPYKGNRSDSEWTGTLVVDYALTETWLGYLSYGRGYKAGGFNLDRAGFSLPNPIAGTLPSTTDLEFEPETVDSYEVGAKGTLWDDRVQLNVAAFWSTFDDFQLNTFTGTNFVVTNLEEVESKGVEVEGQAYLTEGLRLTTGVSYTDAQYDEGISDPVLAGRRLTNAPYWIVTAAADYERPISANLLGFVHLDYRFTGDHNTGSDLDKEKVQPSYAVFNGSIGLLTQDERWEVEVWAKNLFDRDYRQVVFDAPLQTGSWNAFLGDPRTWGIRGRFNF